MTTCSLCNSNNTGKVIVLTTPYLDRKEQYPIYICNDCGHGFTTGRSDAEYLSKIYGDQFHKSSQQAALNAKSPIVVNAKSRAAWLHETLNLNGKLLDIGAGTGTFVQQASNYFSAAGIELSENACKVANENGINIKAGDFLKENLQDNSYDVVTLWDVVASLPNPRITFEKCHDILKPNGALVVTLPMIDSVARKTLGKFWPLWIPPVNLNWFSHQSLTHLSKMTGFELWHTHKLGKTISSKFLFQKAMRSIGLFKLENILEERMFDINLHLNTRDILTAVLRKNSGPAQ